MSYLPVPVIESPSDYWKVRTVEITSIGRRRGGTTSGLRIVFEHIKATGDKVQVIVIVDRQQDLATLKAFLDAATDLPAGFRLEAHVLESAPWDAIKPPRRWTPPMEVEGG